MQLSALVYGRKARHSGSETVRRKCGNWQWQAHARFQEQAWQALPAGRTIHVILYNLNAQKKNQNWLAKCESRVQFDFTTTSAGCLIGGAFSVCWDANPYVEPTSNPTKNCGALVEQFVASDNPTAKPFD